MTRVAEGRDPVLRRVTPEDAPALRALGVDVVEATYRPIDPGYAGRFPDLVWMRRDP